MGVIALGSLVVWLVYPTDLVVVKRCAEPLPQSQNSGILLSRYVSKNATENPMHAHASTGSGSKAMIWAGRIISALVSALFLFAGVMNLTKSAQVVDGMKHFGYPEGLALGLGIIVLVCAILYAIPQTAVLGAILLTGYLGGATATHLRVGEPFFLPIVVGMLVWLGLFLRDARLRALLPLRR